MGIHDNKVPVPDDEKHECVYVPMTSRMVPTTGTSNPFTECMLALQILPTAPCLSTHIPQITGEKSSVQPAHQLERSSDKPDVTFADYLLASGFVNSNLVGDKLPGC